MNDIIVLNLNIINGYQLLLMTKRLSTEQNENIKTGCIAIHGNITNI